MMGMQNDGHAVILFDGVCNLCNGSVNFIIRNDKKAYFKFVPLQSKNASDFFQDHEIKFTEKQSVILSEQGEIYFYSTAALRIARKLDGFYKLLFIFILIPPFIRNLIYDIISKNRYKWFGKKESCMIPTQDIKNRFI